MDCQYTLKQEYEDAGKKVIYCDLGKDKIIVPLSYKGDINSFIDDIFSYEKEAYKYTKFNQRCRSEDEQIDVEMLTLGNIKFLPPFDLVKAGYSDNRIIKKSVSRAIRKYNSSIKKTLKIRKEYPNQKILCNMSDKYLKGLEIKHHRYCAKNIIKKLGDSIKFSTEQIAQMTAGAVGIAPVIAYRLLDKKLHFADTKTKRVIDKKLIPYICKGVLKDLIPLSLIGGLKLSSNLRQDNTSIGDKTEIIKKDTPNLKIDFNKKYKISNPADFELLYNDALNFMALSMFPTEVLVNDAYSDNGRSINTIGLGSFWFPKNGNPQSSTWIKTSEYVRCNGKICLNGAEACDLMDGLNIEKMVGYIKICVNG